MKRILIFLYISILFISCIPQSEKKDNSFQAAEDSVDLKDDHFSKYQADEYGMKKYVLAFLKRGPNQNQDSATVSRIQRDHLNNIQKMADEGKLVLAGPFLDDTDIRGIYIFNVETIEEAEALTNSDPAIKSGRLVMELHPWYGSAALLEVNDIHNQIAGKKI